MDFRKALLSKVEEKRVIGNASLWPELGGGVGRQRRRVDSPSLNEDLPHNVPLADDTPHDVPLADDTPHDVPFADDVPSPIPLPSRPPSKIGRFTHAKPRRRRPTNVISIDIQLALQMAQLKRKKRAAWRKPVKKLQRNGGLGGNRLDSDNPKRKKGKEREGPKKKKLSLFKKALLLAREEGEEDAKKRASMRALIASDPCLRKVCHALKPGLIPLDPPPPQHQPSSHFHPTPRQLALHLIHNKRFREYCNNLTDIELKECAKELIGSLKMFHDRLYFRDPIKAQSKKRFVIGLKEGKRQIMAQSAHLVFIATDLNIKPESELSNVLKEVMGKCEESGVPCVFADVSCAMARWVHIWKGKVSFLTILNYQGAEETYQRLISLWRQKKEAYSTKLNGILERYSQQSDSPDDTERDLLCASLIEKLTCKEDSTKNTN